MKTITLNGLPRNVVEGELLIEVIRRAEVELPAVCYHDQLGPVQTCDTCMVDVDGQLVRACACAVTANARPAMSASMSNA